MLRTFTNSAKTKFEHLSKQMIYLGATSTQTRAVQRRFYESKTLSIIQDNTHKYT